MQDLTGLTGLDWLLVLLYALGAVIVVEAIRRDVQGSRKAGLLIVPVATGVALILWLAIAFSAETRYLVPRLGDRAAGAAALVLAGVTALAFGDLLVARSTRIVWWLLARAVGRRRHVADAALILGLTIPIALAAAALTRIDDRIPSGHALAAPRESGSLTVRARHDLSGHPMDIELTSPTEGYASFGEGWIGRLVLGDDGQKLTMTRVASGLDYPRGIAIVGDELFVAELGPLPCRPSFPSCKGGDVAGEEVETTEREILRTSRGRVLAFDIRRDGSLGERRVVVADLPVANTDHGVNDVELGPDGRLYVAIGGLDRLYDTTGLALDLDRPHADLLGTVVALDPVDGDPKVFTAGLRNVYGLAFDDNGTLYGVDNDGPTRNGWRREEVLELRDGADHGYPEDGTFGPYRRRNDGPLWPLDAVGAGGIAALAGTDDDETRLVTGTCTSVELVELHDVGGVRRVASKADVRRLLELPGCVTSVALADSALVLGVFTFRGEAQLIVAAPPRA